MVKDGLSAAVVGAVASSASTAIVATSVLNYLLNILLQASLLKLIDALKNL